MDVPENAPESNYYCLTVDFLIMLCISKAALVPVVRMQEKEALAKAVPIRVCVLLDSQRLLTQVCCR